MKINLLYICILLIGLNGCAKNGTVSSSANDTSSTETTSTAKKYSGTGTLVIKPIKFSKTAHVRDAVKNECNLDGKLTQFIEKNASTQYAQILTDSKVMPKSAQVLTVEIEEVQGGGGGAWSGGKMVLVNGTLTQRGKVLGSFKGRRYSGGGMFAAYKGTCAIFGRCVKVLGKDIAVWLKQPTENAALGDL